MTLRTGCLALLVVGCYSAVFVTYGWIVVGVAAFVLSAFLIGYQSARWDAEDHATGKASR